MAARRHSWSATLGQYQKPLATAGGGSTVARMGSRLLLCLRLEVPQARSTLCSKQLPAGIISLAKELETKWRPIKHMAT